MSFKNLYMKYNADFRINDIDYNLKINKYKNESS